MSFSLQFGQPCCVMWRMVYYCQWQLCVNQGVASVCKQCHLWLQFKNMVVICVNRVKKNKYGCCKCILNTIYVAVEIWYLLLYWTKMDKNVYQFTSWEYVSKNYFKFTLNQVNSCSDTKNSEKIYEWKWYHLPVWFSF